MAMDKLGRDVRRVVRAIPAPGATIEKYSVPRSKSKPEFRAPLQIVTEDGETFPVETFGSRKRDVVGRLAALPAEVDPEQFSVEVQDGKVSGTILTFHVGRASTPTFMW